MKKNRRVHAVFLCLLFLAAQLFYGSVSRHAVLAKSHQTEKNVDDIILRLSTSKASYGKEDTVRFDLEIDNRSDYRIRSTEIQWKMSKGLELDSEKKLRTELTSIVPGKKQTVSGLLNGDPDIFGRAVPVWFVELILILDFIMIVSAVIAIVVIKGRDKRKRKQLSVMIFIFLLTLGSVFGMSDKNVRASEPGDVTEYQEEQPAYQPASQQSSWIITEERTVNVTLEFEYADEPVKIQAELCLLLESYED